jgi:hypothetical protein
MARDCMSREKSWVKKHARLAKLWVPAQPGYDLRASWQLPGSSLKTRHMTRLAIACTHRILMSLTFSCTSKTTLVHATGQSPLNFLQQHNQRRFALFQGQIQRQLPWLSGASLEQIISVSGIQLEHFQHQQKRMQPSTFV